MLKTIVLYIYKHQKYGIHHFYIIGLLLLGLGACNVNKMALKNLREKEFEKTEDFINKSIAKDTTNPVPYFLYSKLYTQPDYNKFNIDSAHYLYKVARNKFEKASTDQKNKINKNLGIDQESFKQLGLRIDSLAFAAASETHSVRAYQEFIDQFPNASQVNEAIKRRNRLAFEAASNIGTYEAYKSFMDKYPDASQFEKAQSRYNTLVFQEKTKSGNLESYVNFLEVFPNSPYRKVAERNIFEISTAANEIGDYLDFIKKYPRSPFSRQALDHMFHLYKIQHKPDSFFIEYPGLPFEDSLKNLVAKEHQIFAPVYKNGNYGFISENGQEIVAANYPFINPKYLCHGVGNDIIVTAEKTAEGGINTIILNKLANEIARLDNSSIPAQNIPMALVTQDIVKDIGGGILLVKENNKNKLLHKGGHFIMGKEGKTYYDSIALLPNKRSWEQNTRSVMPRFIKFKTGGKWGLKTMTGKTLLEPEYDRISGKEKFIIIAQNNKVAVTNHQSIIDKANDKPFNLSFIYNEVELTDDAHVIAYSGNLETVLNENLEVVIPLSDHQVISLRSQNYMGEHFYWLTRKEIGQSAGGNPAYNNVFTSNPYIYQLYVEDQNRPFEDQKYLRAYFNEKWLALKAEKKYKLFDVQKGQFTEYQYDSIRLLSSNFILLSEKTRSFENNVSILFPGLGMKSPTDSTLVNKKEEELKPRTFRILRPANLGDGAEKTEYLMVEYNSGLKTVINQSGKKVFEGAYKDISVVSPDLFIVEKEGQNGLLDSTGKVLLKPEYQGIGNYKNGFLATLKDSKFGLFSKKHKVQIDPQYESMIKVYNHTSRNYQSAYSGKFIAQKNQKLGLINPENDTITDFKYQEIGFWSDSTAIVKNDSAWSIIKITSSQGEKGQKDEDKAPNYKISRLYSQIDDFEYIKDARDELIIKFFKDQKYGMLSNTRGELFKPDFSNLLIMGKPTGEHPQYIYLAEKYIEEADLFVMIYYNKQGNLIQRNALNPADYEKIYCNPS